MSYERETKEQTLTVGDRLNYPFIIANQILKIQEARVQKSREYDPQEVEEAVKGLLGLIPDPKRDEQFISEVKSSIETVKIDVRPLFCGIRVGEPIYDEHPMYNVEKLEHACVNLLDRLGMLGKIEWTELFTGRRWTEEDDAEIPT